MEEQLHLIVAKYKENVDWISSLNKSSNLKTFVYSKDEEDKNKDVNYILLPNIGREGHTYINHIIDNYFNLAEYNIFCQGNPTCHHKFFMEYLHDRAFANTQINFQWLANTLFECDLFGQPHHRPVPLDIERFLKAINVSVPSSFIKFAPGGQFLVSKKLIQSHPINFYKNILKQFSEELYPKEYKQNDILNNRHNHYYHFACFLERTWELIFTENT